jgi:uncharacterized protein
MRPYRVSVALLILFALVVALTSLISATPRRASAAGFDCSKATAPSDIAVCANPELSAKDDEISRLYRQRKVDLQSQGGDVHAFLVEGRSWLAMRMACKGAPSVLMLGTIKELPT